ncbi:hypothetical protein [Anaeromassilibacillus sp. An200]|uniref:hypothetical protein n=1 Tax=Anaeromassilibacillus sp. An200 TaxID=1965587 RepID=UPI00111E6461|nr:hypothetical protein [Anaeromassilibacillus sp. An200]
MQSMGKNRRSLERRFGPYFRYYFTGSPVFQATLRACLKIEKMPNFFPERGDFQEKSAGILAGFRAFLTQKAAVIGEKDDVHDFSNKP